MFKRKMSGILIAAMIIAGSSMVAFSLKINQSAETSVTTPFELLIKLYGNLPLIDAHNHDASGKKYINMKKFGIRTVLIASFCLAMFRNQVQCEQINRHFRHIRKM